MDFSKRGGVGDHPSISLIHVQELHNAKDNHRFVFDWSQQHWRNHYRELAYIPKVYYYQIKQWKPILNIINGTDPISYALLYMNEEDDRLHIPFVAKLLVMYGTDSVKFEFLPSD